MEKTIELKTRKIKLAPIKVKYTSGNRIPHSCIPKRKATRREALYILQEILGFNLELSFNDATDKEEVNDLKDQFTEALNGFLDGGDWSVLCDDCYCYDDMYDFNFAVFLWLVSYCQEKGIY